MFDKLFGLPAHSLLIHAPIVLIPIVAILSVALAVKPGWRRRASWWWPASVFAVFAMLFAAKESGESFIAAFDRAFGEGSIEIDRHQELADQTQLITFVWLVVVLALTVFEFVRRRQNPTTDLSAGAAQVESSVVISQTLSALAALLGIIATVWLIRTGHEGSNLVWGPSVDQLYPD